MKKILNFFIAVAVLFAVTGCTNALVEKTDVENNTYDVAGDLKDNVTKGSSFAPLSLSTNSLVRTVTNSDGITTLTTAFEFDAAIDESTVDGIKFFALDDAATDDDPYIETPIALTTKVIGNVVYITFSYDSATLKGLKVVIDSTRLASVNGQKLNEDGDAIQGEAGDDDYVEYQDFKLTTGREKKGPQTLYKSQNFSVNADNMWEDKYVLDTLDNLKEMFDARIKMQAYDDNAKAWKDVAITTKWEEDTVNKQSKYTLVYNEPAEDVIMRTLLLDVQNIKTTTKYDGYEKRWTLDNETTSEELDSPGVWNPATHNYATVSDLQITAYSTCGSGDTYQYINTIQFQMGTDLYGADLSKLHFVDSNQNEYSIGEYDVVKKSYSAGYEPTDPAGNVYDEYITYVLKTPICINETGVSLYAYCEPDMSFTYFDGINPDVKVAGYTSVKARLNPVTKGWKMITITINQNGISPINY